MYVTLQEEHTAATLVSKREGSILPVLHHHILEHGWCDHVSTPIHSEQGTRIEKGLQAMDALKRTCNFSSQLGRLKKLTKHFESVLENEQTGSDEYTELLLDYSRKLVKTIRQQNLEL